MKNLTQLPGSGKGSKAKNDNTLGRMRGGIRSRIGSMSLKNTSLFGVILALLLTFGVGEMWGANFPKGGVLFLKPGTNWTQASARFAIYFYGNGETWVSMTSAGSGYYYAVIPSDKEYPNCIFCRMNGSQAANDWSNKWNQSGDLSYNSGKNLFTVANDSWDGATTTWGTYQLTSTASLSASSTSITTAQTSTLTPSLSSNTTYNEIKSTAYSVTTNPGSAGSVTSAGVFSATAAGTYTVTATVTYNAKGFTGITKTATATKSITVSAPASNTLTVNTDGHGTITTPSGGSTSYTIGSPVSISATNNTGYTFKNWTTTSGTVTFGNASSASTTVTVTAGTTATIQANFTENMRTITLTADPSGTGTFTVGGAAATSTTAGISTSRTVAAVANPGYAFVSWTATNCSVASTTSSSTTLSGDGSTGSGTLVANFAPQWNIMGSGTEMGAWGTYNSLAYVSSNTFRGTITLAANTTYDFKVVDRKNNRWYGYGTSSDGTYSFVGQTTASEALSYGDSYKNLRIMTAGEGTYTFEWNSSTNKLTVTYPSVTHPSSDYIYYKNTKSWSNVYGYVYGTTASIWTGPKLETFTFDGTNYYYVALGDNTSIVFNQGNGTNQDDLTSITSNKGKYYDPSSTSWKDFKVTITLNNHSATTAGTESLNPAYKTEVLSDITCPKKTGYNFGGYYTAADGGGSQLINASGEWQTVANYTDASKHWIKNTSVTLHAKWTENTFTVTINNDGNGTTNKSGAQSGIGQVTGIALSVTPNDGKEFATWEIVSGTGSFASAATNGSNTFYPTSTATIRATFRSNRALTVSAGAHVTTVTGSVDPATLNTVDYPISATAFETGWEFNNWTADPAENATIASSTSATTTTKVKNGSVTITANAKQKLSTLSTNNSYNAGDPSYAAPTKSKSSIGIATTATLTATTPGTGYTFTGWTLSSNLVVTSGNKDTDLSITVRTNGNGAAATAQANYAEDLSTPYTLRGGSAFGGSEWAQDLEFTKKSGEASTDIAYLEVPITTAWIDGTNDANYYFKVVNGSTYYGLNAGGSVWNYFSNSGEQTMTTEGGMGNQIRLSANVLGTYVIKLDYTSTPKITITWPTTLQIYRSNPEDDTNIGDHTWATHAGNNYTWALDLEANTTYEFKINQEGAYYGHNTDITTSISNRAFATETGDTKLKTKSAGRFNFTWNGSTHALTLVYPKSAAIGATPASVYPGGTVTLTGYASELGSGSHTITYEFYKGTELTAGNLIASKSNTASATYQQATQDVTVNFDGSTTGQIYTIQIKEGGSVIATNTVTVYRKWDIYVHDVASWNAMKLYMYSEDGLSHNAEWAGPDCSPYNGSTTWYTVTLDAKYDRFILNNNAGKQQTHGGDGALRTDITTYIPGTFWYVSDGSLYEGTTYYGLTKITISAPIVTISATVTNANQINLTGNITNCGGDGMFASDMKEVYFNVNNVKDAADITVGTTTALFTKTLNNPTPDATNNTLQAVATNIGATGSSSLLRFTNVSLNKQSGSSGTSNVLAVNGAAMASGATAPSRTGYAFGGYYASTGGSGTQYYNASMGSANNWDQTTATKTIYAKWTPITYTIHFNGNGNTSGSMSNQTGVTYNSATTITANAFVKTGYNFAGWATTQERANAGTVDRTDGAAHGNLASTQGATAQLWAVWTPKQSAITFNYQTSATGYYSSGDITNASGLKGTYGSAMTALTGTMPSAINGYAFTGFYDATSGGKKYYNADGTSANTWDKDTESGTTLYARWEKAEITNITFSPGTVVENNSSVSVTATISPTPTGTTTICWRVLHNDTGNPLDPQPTFTPSAQGNSVSFTSPNESGMYKVEAVLHTGSGCAGTDLDTREATFQVAGSHTVTVAYKYSGTTIKASTSVTGRPLAWSDEITAPDIFGYSFSSWSAGDGITITDDDGASSKTSSSSATIKIKATYNGTLTANYTLKNIVYFKDNLGWTDPEDADAHIYVNLLTSDYWDTNNGSGNSGVANRNLQMDRVPGTTDIFYYEYGNKTTSNYISFTKESMNNYGNFHQAAPNVAHVVFPSRSLDALGTDKATGLGFYAATPMFVPLATQTPVKKNSNRAEYYNDGYWTKYLPGTGYSLDIYQSNGSTHVKTVAFTSADELMPMKVVTDLEGSHTYKFQLKRDGDVYYGNGGTMTYEDHGQNTAWEFNNSPFSMCTIVTNAAGEYTFNLSFSPNNGGTSNRLRISVDYPVANGDYRLIYTDNTRDSGTRYKPSAIVNKENNGTAIVSFFVRHNNSPVLRIQQATVDNSGNITWNEYPTSGTPTNQITGSIASAITKDTVYNFNLSMNGSGALSVSSVEYYSGNYYIRTDAANSKWDNYRTDPDHLMTYSEYSITHGGYSHYYTHWVNKDDAGRKNVKFCIANDYSPCISDTLARETASGAWAHIADWMEEGGDLKRSANVRFMWDIATNTISRAYVDGAQYDGSEFLLMLNADSPNKIKWADGTALTSNKVTFSDNGNWIYETNIKAQPNAKFKLKSTWGNTGNAIVQYFKGTSSEDETLIGGSGTDWYDFRLIYDFKTNRLVASYVPTTGTISTDVSINADVMFIREHQGDIAQLTFSGSGKISKINTAYGVMRFSKWTLNNKAKAEPHSPLGTELSRFERDIFYISFPFRVNLEEVFGFGTYGTHWIIEEYDGAERASKGFWAETETFWKFITNRRGKFLEPNTGYILALDLDELGESSSVWANTDVVELYFPSYGTMPNITASSVTHKLPEHTCTIGPRFSGGDDRRMKDSHWNVMSVPTYINTDDVTFANTDWITTKTETTVGPQFLYTWNMNNNTLTATSGTSYTYKAMHAYMVQYCGNVTWTTSVSPALAPRRSEDAPTDVEFRLELQQDEQKADQAFIKLSYDEHVTTGFDFNYDLSKEMNGGKANIYTMITSVIDNEASVTEAAGNVLPMSEQTTVVPVGVKIATNGDYTFSIPEGTEGVGVMLIDTETGIRTSLSALDYTVSLEAGTYNDRFVIEISPIQHVATELEPSAVGDQQSDVRKLLIDGLLYIVRDGKMFDARGARVE